MISWTLPLPNAQVEMFARACDARDARFDGVFFVGITTTHIYCRPGCPARISYRDRRRFFRSAAAAEREGFRPCLRCRPELAPGLALMDSVPRLARTAERRIAAGALNGRTVADLAHDLHVSERHLRRALERELGVSPLELAQTHRLLLSKQLLTDTDLSVTRIAYASGFQSLRRFNTAFREHYRLAPSAIRHTLRARRAPPAENAGDVPLQLRLAYRAPLDWATLLACLRSDAIPGVERVDDRRYARTIEIGGHRGVVAVEAGDALPSAASRRPNLPRHHLRAYISPALVPVLMPLLARLRQLFDLDAEPSVIDRHLAQGGLKSLIAQRPGLRIPGAVDGFDVALRVIARGGAPDWRHRDEAVDLPLRIADALGERIESADQCLRLLTPTAARISEAGLGRLEGLGMPSQRAAALMFVAKLVTDGSLFLEPGCDVRAARTVLADIPGIDHAMIESILMRALRWPDACPGVAGLADAPPFSDAAPVAPERCRPWRAYATLHQQIAQACTVRTGVIHPVAP